MGTWLSTRKWSWNAATWTCESILGEYFYFDCLRFLLMSDRCTEIKTIQLTFKALICIPWYFAHVWENKRFRQSNRERQGKFECSLNADIYVEHLWKSSFWTLTKCLLFSLTQFASHLCTESVFSLLSTRCHEASISGCTTWSDWSLTGHHHRAAEVDLIFFFNKGHCLVWYSYLNL